MTERTEYRNPTDENSTENSEQRSDREHTGLRTLNEHHSAREVFLACHAPYPGTGILREKERLRARASTARAQSSDSGAGTTAAQDRSGESGASL